MISKEYAAAYSVTICTIITVQSAVENIQLISRGLSPTERSSIYTTLPISAFKPLPKLVFIHFHFI